MKVTKAFPFTFGIIVKPWMSSVESKRSLQNQVYKRPPQRTNLNYLVRRLQSEWGTDPFKLTVVPGSGVGFCVFFSYIRIKAYLEGADFFCHVHILWTDVLLLCITSRVQLRVTAGLSVGKNYQFKSYVPRPASQGEDERSTYAKICRHLQPKSSKTQIYFSGIAEIIFRNRWVSFLPRTVSPFNSAEEPVQL